MNLRHTPTTAEPVAQIRESETPIHESAARIQEPVASSPEPNVSIPEPVEGSDRRPCLRDRGAVTAEKALLIAVVIVFGWLGIRFAGDPLRDPVFRVVYGFLLRIYELIATAFGGAR